ncbi:MAG: hypothetical protein J6X36_05225 [Lachnospiraceae bacterium]|nr:hypothetical protein [Lachnospiraceae bacterium]
MACFLVLTAEAIVTTVAEKVIEKKEKTSLEAEIYKSEGKEISDVKIPLSKKLKWLNNMAWGGCALLAFEHVWHGEVVPWFPFLTAASNAEDAAEMLHEMGTVGVVMAALVTTVWLGMCAVASYVKKRAVEKDDAKAEV